MCVERKGGEGGRKGLVFCFASRRRHTRLRRDWSSDVCSSDLSLGGMQVLQWAASFPDRVFAAVPIATAANHSSQNIAFHEVGRQAIMADPDWCGGAYLKKGVRPHRGLSVARMAAHITYLSEIGRAHV